MARLKGKHVRQDDGGRRRATRSEGTQAHRDVKAGRSRGPKHLRTNNASPASRQSAQSEPSQGRRGQSRTGRSDADHGRTSQGRPSQNRPTQSNPAPHRTTQSWPNSSASRRASQSRTGQGSSSAPRLATQSRFSRSSAPQGRPSQSRTGQGSPASRRASQSRTSQGSPSTRRSTPSQGTRRTAPRHRRNQSSLQKLRLRLRSPYLAYAVVAIAFGALLFALTMPAEPDYVEEPLTIEEPQKPYPEHDEYVEPRAVAHEFAGSSAAAVSAS